MKELKSWEESQTLLKSGTKDKPSLVIHYWNKCRHCIKKMPMWEEFSKQLGDKYNLGKLEASKNGGNINAFPTYQGSNNGSIKQLNNQKCFLHPKRICSFHNLVLIHCLIKGK